MLYTRPPNIKHGAWYDQEFSNCKWMTPLYPWLLGAGGRKTFSAFYTLSIKINTEWKLFNPSPNKKGIKWRTFSYRFNLRQSPIYGAKSLPNLNFFLKKIIFFRFFAIFRIFFFEILNFFFNYQIRLYFELTATNGMSGIPPWAEI